MGKAFFSLSVLHKDRDIFFFLKRKERLPLCVYFFSFGEHKMISPRKTETQKNRRRPVFDFQNLWARGSPFSLSLSKGKEKERETSLSKRRKRIGIYKFKRMNKARASFSFLLLHGSRQERFLEAKKPFFASTEEKKKTSHSVPKSSKGNSLFLL